MWRFELHAPPSRQELDPAAAVATTSRTEEINKKKSTGPQKGPHRGRIFGVLNCQCESPHGRFGTHRHLNHILLAPTDGGSQQAVRPSPFDTVRLGLRRATMSDRGRDLSSPLVAVTTHHGRPAWVSSG